MPFLSTVAFLGLVLGGDAEEDRLSFFANGRVRWDSVFQPPSGADRHRGRLRFRAGGEYTISETLVAGARVSTISDGHEANNPHWDFGDGAEGFAGGDLVLDRLYLDWRPVSSLGVTAGKFKDPFRRSPVFGEFVWDADLSPAGIAAIWKPNKVFDLRVSEIAVQENAAEKDPYAFGFQANLASDLRPDLHSHLASGVQYWGNVETGVFENQGNSSFAGGFAIWDTLAIVEHDGGWLERQQFFVEYVNNIEDDTGQDTAFLTGFELGRKQPGETVFLFTYFDFDANSLFSPVAQDLTPIPGTGAGMGMTGVLAGFRHFVNEDLSIRVLGLTSHAELEDDPYRFVIDFDFNMM